MRAAVQCGGQGRWVGVRQGGGGANSGAIRDDETVSTSSGAGCRLGTDPRHRRSTGHPLGSLTRRPLRRDGLHDPVEVVKGTELDDDLPLALSELYFDAGVESIGQTICQVGEPRRYGLLPRLLAPCLGGLSAERHDLLDRIVKAISPEWPSSQTA